MATILRPFLFFCLMISLFLPSSAQSCLSYSFSRNRAFRSCADLRVLNSFLHWTYNNNQLQIAYRHTGMQSSRWTAWAINPTGRGMAGSQALVAFQRPDGTPTAYTSPISSYQTTLAPGNLSFAVSNIGAEFTNNEMIIFATLELPNGGATTLNHVWQEGPLNGNSPSIHPTSGANVQSTGTLDVRSGQTGSGGTVVVRQKKKNTHGILNAVSWGILMPLGATIARYLRVFKSADPAWFYLHVGCQCSAYIVGVAGWATGLKLGSDSEGIQYNPHRNIGIILFSIATLQLFALLVRPKKDHKYRLYWNIYHHSIGYAVIILSVINIYKGFDILKPDKKWKRAYTGIIIALGANALWLEAYTWYVVLMRKKTESADKYPQGNGVNGVNGYGARQGV